MSAKDILKFFASCVIVAAIVGAGYIVWRYYEVPTNADLNAATTSEAFAKFSSVICTFSTGGFDSSEEGTIYISHGSFYTDITSVNGGSTQVAHTLLTPSGQWYEWTDGQTSGYEAQYDSMSPGEAQFQTSQNTRCAPWWFPNDSLFQVPSTVTFGPLPSTQQ